VKKNAKIVQLWV